MKQISTINGIGVIFLAAIILLSIVFLVLPKNFQDYVVLNKNSSQKSVPVRVKSFTYNNKPIHPSCLGDLESIVFSNSSQGINSPELNSLDIKECNHSGDFQEGSALGNSNGIIYNRRCDAKNCNSPEGWFYVDNKVSGYYGYKVLENVGDKFLVATDENNDGYSHHTSLFLITYKNDTLTLFDSIDDGERCHSLLNYQISGNDLYYSKNLTATDMLGERGSDMYGHLDSDFSCVALANYKYTFGNERTPISNLISVTLPKTLPPKDPNFANSTYQDCFNNLLNSYITANNRKFTIPQYNEFQRQFFNLCVNNHV